MEVEKGQKGCRVFSCSSTIISVRLSYSSSTEELFSRIAAPQLRRPEARYRGSARWKNQTLTHTWTSLMSFISSASSVSEAQRSDT